MHKSRWLPCFPKYSRGLCVQFIFMINASWIKEEREESRLSPLQSFHWTFRSRFWSFWLGFPCAIIYVEIQKEIKKIYSKSFLCVSNAWGALMIFDLFSFRLISSPNEISTFLSFLSLGVIKTKWIISASNLPFAKGRAEALEERKMKTNFTTLRLLSIFPENLPDFPTCLSSSPTNSPFQNQYLIASKKTEKAKFVVVFRCVIWIWMSKSHNKTRADLPK